MKTTLRSTIVVLSLIAFALLLRANIPQVPTGTWAAGSSLNSARSGASAVLLPDGRILIVGGTDATDAVLASAELVNTDGSISSAAPMNVARTGAAVIVLPMGDVLVTGGRTSDGGITNSAELYDPLANAWQTLPATMASPRSGHTMSQLLSGDILIAGGDSSSGPVAALEIYDETSKSFSQVGSLATGRKDHAAAVLQDGRVLIAGGTSIGADGNPSALSSTEIFDPMASAVSAGPSLSSARARHSATTLLDGKVLVAGGNDGTNDLASAEIFDPAANSFSAASASMSGPRSGHLAFLLPNNNSVLIVGGSSAGNALASVELYIPWTGAFQATGSMSAARASAAGAPAQQDGLLLVAGGSDQSNAELYGFATVKTDYADYAPGSTVNVSGAGWQPGETVTLTLVESPNLDTHGPYSAIADAAGNISDSSFVTDIHDLNVRFYLTAVGSTSQAQNTFMDANLGTVTVAAQVPTPVVAGNIATFNPVTVNFGGNNSACTVTLSANGLPSGASALFIPPSVTGANNNTPKTTSLTVGTTSGVPAGSYSFTVTATPSGGTCNGGAATSPAATLSVQNTTNLSVGAVTGVFGQTVNLSATLTSGTPPVGESGQTITFTLNGNAAGSATTNASGTATRSSSLSTIPVGVYPTGVQASFAGNGPILASSATNSLTVNQASTTTTITAPNLNPATNVGQSYTVSWTVAPVAPGSGTPTGTVTVTDGTDSCGPVAVATGSCLFTSNTAGSPKTLTATYSGDSNFLGSSGTQTHNVSKVNAATTVTSLHNPSVFGQSVTFTATVSGAGATPTGTVQFVVDGSNFGAPVTLAAGSATSDATTSLTVAGSPHSVTANYSGDPNYNNGSGSLAGSQIVNKASTAAFISSDLPDPSVVGQAVIVQYSVSVNPPGGGSIPGADTVSVSDGVDSCSGTVTAGQCSISLSTSGLRSLKATYQGSANYNASPASLGESHQVNPADTTTSVVSSQPVSSVFAQSVNFTATVAAVAPGSGTPAGNVNFYDGGTCGAPGPVIATNVALSGGQAGTSSSSLSVSGSPHSILTCYLGNANFNASNGSVSQTVKKADTTASITSDNPDPSVVGQAVIVQYSVSVNPPGGGSIPGADTVNVSDGVDSCSGTVTAGQCLITLSTAGTRTLKATYQGSANYNASPASAGESHLVKTPASLSYTASVAFDSSTAPGDTIVRATQSITVKLTVHNSGQSDASNVAPPTLTVNTTGTAASTCGTGNPGSPTVMGGTNQTYTYSCGPVSGDGTLSFTTSGQASGTDAISGNSVSTSGSITSNSVTVDSTAPTVTVNPASGSYTVASTLAVTWSATDSGGTGAGTGVTCSVVIDGGAPTTACSGTQNFGAGAHTFSVTGTDGAGNVTTVTRNYTVIIDSTPPIVTITFAAPDGQNNWYVHSPVVGSVDANDSTTGNSNVSAISCTDGVNVLAVGSLSNIGTPHATGSISVSGEGTHNISCTATDSAGNTGAFTGSTAMPVVVKIDTVKPSLSASRLTAANANGWNNTDVGVRFTCTDATSGLASINATGAATGSSSTSPLDVTVTTEGMNQTVNGSCKDAAGNSADPASVTGINIDKTKPVISGSPSPAVNGNGWNKTDVTVSFTCADNVGGSGVDINTVAGATLTTEGSGQSVTNTGSCVDKAGNAADSATVSNIKIDKTAPSVSGTPDRGAERNGWYNHVLTITWSGTDSLSGIDFCDANTNYSGPDSASVSESGHCTDKAGNQGTANFSFKFDATGPSAALSVTAGTLGNNNWYTSDVTVQTSGSDSVSSPVICTADQLQTTDTADQAFNGSCTNDAGLSTDAATLHIKLDKHAPNAPTASKNPPANAAGWNNSDVTVSFSANGEVGPSGIASCTGSSVLSAETSGTDVHGTCTDNAGNVSAQATVTVKIDKTKPVISGSRNPAANANGWNNTPVMVSFSCAEVGAVQSGIASNDVAGQTVSSEVADLTVTNTGSCVDVAGNTADSASVAHIKIDMTPPAAPSGHRSPAANAAGWNNSVPVNVSFTDNGDVGPVQSGVDTCTGGGSVNGETAGTDFNGSCSDKAGNSSSAILITVKVDLTKPVITGNRSPGPNVHGWNNSPVTVGFSCADTGGVQSGIATDTVAGQTVSTEVADLTVSNTGSCVDVAGNTADSASVAHIKIDMTPPIAPTAHRSPGPNIYGWNNTDVAVSFSDNGDTGAVQSGIDTCTSPSNLTTETSGTPVSGTCTDNAGNPSAATSVTIMIDKTKPVITGMRSPGPNQYGWNNTDVAVSFSCADTGSVQSDIASSTVAGATLSGEGAGQSVTNSGACTDKAGNMADSATVSGINIDKTPPTISVALDRPAAGTGWFNIGTQRPTASFTCGDTLSGLPPNACPGPQGPLPDGGDQTVSGSVADKAGNMASASIMHIKVDLTPPSITINAPINNGSYILNQLAASNYSCNDTTSGVASCAGPVANGANFSTNPVAGHSFTVNATDAAGNPATLKYNYSVLYSTGACLGDLGHAVLQPINATGTMSVFKLGSTVPTKFRVCDANGVSIGTPGVVTGYGLVAAANSPTITVDEDVYSTTPDIAFRWAGDQWIFNQSTKNNGSMNKTGVTYLFTINLNDGSSIFFQYGLK